MSNRLRVYADTSVYGGAFDKEFSSASRVFFDQVRRGYFSLVISAVVRQELLTAPASVRGLYRGMLPLTEAVEAGEESVRLAEAYLTAGILTPQSTDDALHVAIASVSGCGAIVSWNFRHIVHFQKIPLYNAVNAVHGYRSIEICSPPGVIVYEDEDQGL
ncbi:MAG: type II toxin-antitoxin system VapC family toxin [Planctomycetota bacterium]|nr:type II toxin-antitoxin system VapC family toxin [Planctomycetota bacterium]